MKTADGMFSAPPDIEWSHLTLPPSTHQETINGGKISTTDTVEVSNPHVPLPDGLVVRDSFLSESEEAAILDSIRDREYKWEGFDHRRKVQHYSFDSDFEDNETIIAPDPLLQLRTRMKQEFGHDALHVTCEEYSTYSHNGARLGEHNSKAKSTVFESLPGCDCPKEGKECACFVAIVPLQHTVIEHLHKPARRQTSCWKLESDLHWTDIRLSARSLFIKTHDCLWNWRHQLSGSPEQRGSVHILKFSHLNTSKHDTSLLHHQHHGEFGYVPERDTAPLPPPDAPLPPLPELLTIIITTSPVRSIPSTELIGLAMDTFNMGGEDFAFRCPKVIVCDGVRRIDSNDENGNSVSKKHTTVKQAMRSGIVTGNQALDYEQYKENLREMCRQNADNPKSPFHNTIVVALDERQGFGFALRHVLLHNVHTRFCCVIQHDRTFMRPTPISQVVHAMWRHPKIKYVGMSQRSNLLYRDIFLGKYGRAYMEELCDLIERPPELLLDATEFGPDSTSTKAMVYGSDAIRDNITALVQTYRNSRQYGTECEYREKHPIQEGKSQLTLTPTIFWYDNVHICETEHYRDFIFNPRFKMVARGGFVEDKLSPILKRNVDRLGLKEGHSRYGCFLLDDHSGMFFTGHLDGGNYIPSTERSKLHRLSRSWAGAG